MAEERLTRDLPGSMIGGVCAGFARRYSLDVSLLRVVAVLVAVATGGIAVLAYIAAWIVMPRNDATQTSAATSPAQAQSVGDEMREVSERVIEAARVLADKTREAAEEIAEIARRGAAAPSTSAPTDPTTPDTAASSTPGGESNAWTTTPPASPPATDPPSTQAPGA